MVSICCRPFSAQQVPSQRYTAHPNVTSNQCPYGFLYHVPAEKDTNLAYIKCEAGCHQHIDQYKVKVLQPAVFFSDMPLLFLLSRSHPPFSRPAHTVQKPSRKYSFCVFHDLKYAPSFQMRKRHPPLRRYFTCRIACLSLISTFFDNYYTTVIFFRQSCSWHSLHFSSIQVFVLCAETSLEK